MRWGVIDTPRGRYMAKATRSRGRSNKTGVSVRPDTLRADSQIGNAETSAKELRCQRAAVAIQPCAPFLTETDAHSEIEVILTKQTVRSFLTETRIDCLISRSPFLTGSDPQTEFDVTPSKQTTERFLTGARTAISVLRKHISNRELTMRRASASRAKRGICFPLSNRELLELEHAPTH